MKRDDLRGWSKTQKISCFKAWEKLSEKEQSLLLIATNKYTISPEAGIIPPDVFISSGIWKLYLTDNRMGVC